MLVTYDLSVMPPRTRGGYPVFLDLRLLLGGAALGGLVKPNELHGQPIARLSSLACRKLADEALCDAHTLSDLRLRHPGLRQVGDEVLPVHAPIIAFAII